MPRRTREAGLALAGMSGLLYGSVNVGAKLVAATPLVTAGAAYLVGALALLPWTRSLRVAPGDWPKILAMGLIGGGLSPALLFLGLEQATAVDAALLLTAELAATAVLAVLFVGERETARGWTGIAVLGAAAALAALAGARTGETTARGALLVLAAALGWGIDNAVSARLVGTYEVRGLLGMKALLGAAATLAAAALMGDAAPTPQTLVELALLGLAGITLSSLCYYHALRLVGAARTSAMNIPTTALVGAVGGFVLLGEPLGWLHALAFAAVASGVLLLAGRPAAAPGPA